MSDTFWNSWLWCSLVAIIKKLWAWTALHSFSGISVTVIEKMNQLKNNFKADFLLCVCFLIICIEMVPTEYSILNACSIIYAYVVIQQTVSSSRVLTSNWIWEIHRCRVARHNMPVMFSNGLDFPMNFLNPELTNITVTCTANIPCRDGRHVVLVQSL